MKKAILLILILLISGCEKYIHGEFKEGVTEQEGFKDWEIACMKTGGEFKWTYPNHTMTCTLGDDIAIFIYEGNGKWKGKDN